eukprot:3395480-Pleurochrysis_carterae.AAC.1
MMILHLIDESFPRRENNTAPRKKTVLQISGHLVSLPAAHPVDLQDRLFQPHTPELACCTILNLYRELPESLPIENACAD